MSELLKCKDVSVYYGKKEIVKKVNIEIESGSLVALVGANGSGKTTLLKGLLGFAKSTGEILAGSENTQHLSVKERAKKFAYVPQFSEITYSIDVMDVLAMGFNPYLSFWERADQKMMDKVHKVASDFNISHLLDKDYLSLSGGERQLVIMARVFLQDSDVCLLDEPDSAMDFMNRHQSLELLRKRIKEENKAALITIHDPNFALVYCDKIYMMKQGSVVSCIDVNQISQEMLKAELSNIYGDIDVIVYNERYLMVKS